MKTHNLIPEMLAGILIFISLSCSSDSVTSDLHSPVSPDLSQTQSAPIASTGRYLWSWSMFYYDSENSTLTAIPVRNIEGHWNTLKWLEGGPCTICVKVLSFTDSGVGTKYAEVQIKHPFLNPNLTGFDVRGIAMFNGSFDFPVTGVTTQAEWLGDGKVVNADGYTTLYNFSTEGSGPNGLQGYKKGKFATPTAPAANLNGFKRYITYDPANTRNAFYANDSVTATYELDMPDSSFVFGYAVDACWVSPTTKPVTNPMTDFPPEANCPEPWKVDFSISPLGVGFTDKGGAALLTVDVYDHQGKDSHKTPLLEVPYLGAFQFEPDWLEDTPEYARYQTTMTLFGDFTPGMMEFLASVEDSDNATSPEWLDLTSYQRASTEVTTYEYSGWAKTWGGANWEGGGMDAASDFSGNVFVVGEYQETVDFDPNDGVEERTSNGGREAYLAKFNSDGGLVWVQSWGGTGYDCAYGVAVNIEGEPFVTGSYADTVDFDPGAGTESHTSIGSSDGFVSAFDRDGNFKWVETWGDLNYEAGWTITVDSNTNIVVGGTYDANIFVMKMYPDSSYYFAFTLPGSGNNNCRGISTDNDGNIFIGGAFENTVDFDPADPGLDNHTSNGSLDAYLAKYDIDGNLIWAKTWGSTGLDETMDVEVHGYNTIVAVGRFDGTVDFDPDPVGEDYHISAGWQDAYLSKFDGDGAFEFANTWGAPGAYLEWEYAEGVAISNALEIYVSGRFGTTVDFDPGAGTTELTANGITDCFVVKFNVLGGFQWARGWGGAGEDSAHKVDINQLGDVFVTGTFWGTVDFDPGAGVDEHTSNGQQDVFLSKFSPDGEW